MAAFSARGSFLKIKRKGHRVKKIKAAKMENLPSNFQPTTAPIQKRVKTKITKSEVKGRKKMSTKMPITLTKSHQCFFADNADNAFLLKLGNLLREICPAKAGRKLGEFFLFSIFSFKISFNKII